MSASKMIFNRAVWPNNGPLVPELRLPRKPDSQSRQLPGCRSLLPPISGVSSQDAGNPGFVGRVCALIVPLGGPAKHKVIGWLNLN
jgi:hypothetical protein